MRKLMIIMRALLVVTTFFLAMPVLMAWGVGRLLVDIYKDQLRRAMLPAHKRDNYMPEQQPRGATNDGWEPADKGD